MSDSPRTRGEWTTAEAAHNDSLRRTPEPTNSAEWTAECAAHDLACQELIVRVIPELQHLKTNQVKEVLRPFIREAINRALAEAREDTARLDWLNSQLNTQEEYALLTWEHDGRRGTNRKLFVHRFAERGGTDEHLRDAIDTARGVQPAAKESAPAEEQCVNHYSDGSKIFPNRDCCASPAQEKRS